MVDIPVRVIIDAIDNASKTFQGMGTQVNQMGTALIAIGAAPTAALFGATKAAIDFEDSFAGVKKTVDLTEAEFEQLSERFRDISKSTPLAVNDLNKIGEIAGSLGISGVENLVKFTDTIAKIGITTNLTEEEAAMSFGRIVNIMQEPIENIDRMGATTVDLGNKFAATEREIAMFAERIAGAGKIAGLTTSDVLAIGAAMSSVGVEAEAGGTAVQKVLISMYQAATGSTSSIIDNTKAIAKNTDKLADLQNKLAVAQKKQSEFGEKTKESTKLLNDQKIQKYTADIASMTQETAALTATNGQAAISADGFAKVLGLTNKEFQTMFKQSPTAIFEAFVEKLGEVSAAGGDAAGILDDLDMSDQRLIRSFLSLSNAGDLLHNTIDTGRASWQENAALQTEAEKRYATTASQIQIMKNNLYDLGITIGEVILPVLNQWLEQLKPVIEQVSAFTKEHPQLTVAILGAAAALGVIGIALVAVSAILPGLTLLIAGVGTAITGATAVIGIIVGVLGGPLTIAIIAIMAIVAALTIAWNNNWGDIQGKTEAVVKNLTKWFSDLWDSVKKIWDWLGNVISRAGEAISATGKVKDNDRRQFGGPVNSLQPVMVGEAGPEMFVPQTAGRIQPAHESGGAGGGNTIQFIINSPMIINSPSERRSIAEALYKDLVTLAKSQNITVAKMMGA